MPADQETRGVNRTMVELSAAEYHTVGHLFADMVDNRAALFSTIEGRSPGRVFVDRAEKPATACVAVCSAPSDLYLGGDQSDFRFNRALQDLLVTEIMPPLGSGTRVAHLMLYSASEGWRTVLDHLLEEHGGRRITRTQFTFHRERFASLWRWRERIPRGFHVRVADRELAEQIPGIVEFWGSIDSFLSEGFFFCVMKDDEMISRSGTVFVGDGRAEIGVETVRPFRRQGFATLAACACIERCLEAGLLPQWGCFYNPASGALAEKLGFVEKAGVEVNYVRIGE
jgi:RimJ/RimL family protein N-acetyltransferase